MVKGDAEAKLDLRSSITADKDGEPIKAAILVLENREDVDVENGK